MSSLILDTTNGYICQESWNYINGLLKGGNRSSSTYLLLAYIHSGRKIRRVPWHPEDNTHVQLSSSITLGDKVSNSEQS